MYQHGGDIYSHNIVLDFSSNINLLGTPQGVIEAAYEGIRQSNCYPDTQCTKLREKISAKEQIPKENILCGNGAADLIYSIANSQRPKKALIPIPTFYEYEQALHMVDCKIEYYERKESANFTLEEDFISSMNETVDIIILCNPNNPTGNIIERKLLQEILKQCEKYHILLVIDECFMDFVEHAEQYSIKELSSHSKNLFILKAFTKLYAMPGLRLGYGICSDLELLEKMKQVTQPWNVSIPAQMAGIAALDETDYVIRSLNILKDEKTYLRNELTKLNYKVYESRANYLFFQADLDLYEKCLKKGILIRDCSNYEGLHKGYYRIAVKRPEENMQLIAALKEML